MKVMLTDLMLEASSPHCKVAHLLWRTHRVAEQVADVEVAQWSARELTGYSDSAPPPSYRIIHTRVWARLPGSDWTPLELPGEDLERFLQVHVNHNAGALADLLDRSGVRVEFPFSAQEIVELRTLRGNQSCEFMRHVSRGKLEGVLRHIRHFVREWAFKRIDPAGTLPEKALPNKPTMWTQFFRSRIKTLAARRFVTK